MVPVLFIARAVTLRDGTQEDKDMLIASLRYTQTEYSRIWDDYDPRYTERLVIMNHPHSHEKLEPNSPERLAVAAFLQRAQQTSSQCRVVLNGFEGLITNMTCLKDIFSGYDGLEITLTIYYDVPRKFKSSLMLDVIGVALCTIWEYEVDEDTNFIAQMMDRMDALSRQRVTS